MKGGGGEGETDRPHEGQGGEREKLTGHRSDREGMKGGEREELTGHRRDREGMKGGGGGGEREKLTGHRSDRCYRQNMVIVTWDPGHTMADRQATGVTDATDRTLSLSLGIQATEWPTDCVAVSQSCTGKGSWGHGSQRLLLSPLVCAWCTDQAS